jgi:hypothetical protein
MTLEFPIVHFKNATILEILDDSKSCALRQTVHQKAVGVRKSRDAVDQTGHERRHPTADVMSARSLKAFRESERLMKT